MTTQQAISPIAHIEFHQRNSPVMNVTTYGFSDKGDAVLIRTTHGTGHGYRYVSYCRTHEIAWEPRDFGVCPICDPERATRRQLK